MMELLKKILYAGVGAIAVTEEKAKEIVSELEKKGEVTTEEGKKLVNDLVEKGKQRGTELKQVISDEVKKAIGGLHLVDKDSFADLSKKVEQLNEKLDKIHGDSGKKHG
jgi:polyhydroxyalkanoate synthesis regulator phasin